MVTFGSHVGNHQFQPFLSWVYAGVNCCFFGWLVMAMVMVMVMVGLVFCLLVCWLLFCWFVGLFAWLFGCLVGWLVGGCCCCRCSALFDPLGRQNSGKTHFFCHFSTFSRACIFFLQTLLFSDFLSSALLVSSRL